MSVLVINQLPTHLKTLKRWYFNVVKVGAGNPSCSYSFQLYRWMVVLGVGDLCTRAGKDLAAVFLLFIDVFADVLVWPQLFEVD